VPTLRELLAQQVKANPDIPRMDEEGKTYFVDDLGRAIPDGESLPKPDGLDWRGVADAATTTAASAPLVVPQMLGTLYGMGRGILRANTPTREIRIGDDVQFQDMSEPMPEGAELIKEYPEGLYGTQDAANRIGQEGLEWTESVASIPGYESLVTPSTEKGAEYLDLMSRVAERYLPPVLAGGAYPLTRVGTTIREMTPSVREKNQRAFMGSTDVELATQKMNTEGMLVRDIEAIEAIDAGFDPTKINHIKNASEADRRLMRRMNDTRQNIIRLGQDDVDRAFDVPGRILNKRLKQSEQLRRSAGADIDRIANKYFRGLKIDGITEVGEKFISRLEDLDIPAIRNPDTGIVFDLRQSVLSEGGQRLIGRVLKRLETTPLRDARDLHYLKRWIDNTVSYTKQAEGLDADAEIVVKRLRADVDDYLKKIGTKESSSGQLLIGENNRLTSDYAAANRQYSMAVGAVKDLERFLGSRIDMEDPEAATKLGGQLKGLISNRQQRGDIRKAVRQIDQVVDEFLDPADRDNNDLMTLIRFADALDETVGPEPSAGSSFRTQISRGVGDVFRDPGSSGGFIKRGGRAVSRAIGDSLRDRTTPGGEQVRRTRDQVEKLRRMRRLLTARREMPRNYYDDVRQDLSRITYRDEVGDSIPDDPNLFVRAARGATELPRLAPPIIATTAAGTVAPDLTYDPETGELRANR